MEKKTKNENINGIALENKTGKHKSTSAVCHSRKSTFLKPIINKTNKKQNGFRRL